MNVIFLTSRNNIQWVIKMMKLKKIETVSLVKDIAKNGKYGLGKDFEGV